MRRTRVRHGVRAAVAAVTGVAAVAALAAVAVLGDQWAQSWTGAEQRAVAAGTRTVGVQPADATLVCPTPVALPKGADVGDAQFDATPVPTVSGLGALVLGGAEDGARTTALDGKDEAPLDTGDDAAAQQGDVDGTRVLRATPVPGEPFRAAGLLASVTAAGDLRGLGAGACGVPSTSQWLVGGGTEVGATATLTVQNPSERPATVALDVFGPGGPVALGGSGTFTVAPHAQVTTRLESVAPEQDRLAVHVRASGARVTASLQTQAIDGLLPAGVDVLTAGAAPREAVAVGGVVSRGEAVDDPHAPRLRLLAPGEGGGAARVSVYGPSGPVVLRGADEVELEPGVVTDVPLGGLPAGGYTVVVDADVPVVAAARFDQPGEQPEDSVVGGTPYDVAWAAGQAVAGSGAAGPAGQVGVPGGVRTALTLAAVPRTRDPDADPAGAAPVTLRAYDASGAEIGSRELDLAAGTTTSVPLSDVVADGTVPAGVSVDRGDGEGVVVSWAAVLRADDGTAAAGTLVASVAPTAAVTTPGAVEVRTVDAAG
ncbi:DUF5719 family protein [Isoptericola sp. 4D.3]|uniref:DUF5719 family protein n=1 Tax=Isoptericola peretonis TaxID=2918523 RepID=A0ABT0J690_9MICO|nr:DUF5719 family protein [Isoptericola sp. 4D.3]